jgi:hypothetical protein
LNRVHAHVVDEHRQTLLSTERCDLFHEETDLFVAGHIGDETSVLFRPWQRESERIDLRGVAVSVE